MDSPRRKVTSQLLSSMSTLRGDQDLSIIVQYVPRRRIMRHAQMVAGLRQSYQYRLAPFAHAHATLDAITALEQDDEVVRIFQDSPVHALLDQAPTHIGVPHIWATGYSGAGVSIAIVDTGVDAQHPDLEGRIVDLLDVTGETAPTVRASRWAPARPAMGAIVAWRQGPLSSRRACSTPMATA